MMEHDLHFSADRGLVAKEKWKVLQHPPHSPTTASPILPLEMIRELFIRKKI
jgi:hypothetical protein